MNDMSLSSLYRRLMSGRTQPELDAQQLASVVVESADTLDAERRSAVVAALATSPRQADLARMLKALAPVSEKLAESVDKSRRATHPQRMRTARPAAGARRGHPHYHRWAAGIAACLAVTLGLSLWHVEKAQHERHHITASTHATGPVSSSDRIFTSEDVIFAASEELQHRQPAQHGDELFRGNFAVGG